MLKGCGGRIKRGMCMRDVLQEYVVGMYKRNVLEGCIGGMRLRNMFEEYAREI